MMDMYAEYIKERENFETYVLQGVLEPIGFGTYQIQDKQVYLRDLFVRPALRNNRYATAIANKISEIARNLGCTKMLGSVLLSTGQSTESTKILLAYGFQIQKCSETFILFEKDL